MQGLITDRSAKCEELGVLSCRLIICTTLPQSKVQGTSWKSGQKECENWQMSGRAVKYLFLDWTWLLHTSTHSNYDYLYNIKPVKIPRGVGGGNVSPSAEMLLSYSPLGTWLLVGCSDLNGWLFTHAHMGSANLTWGLAITTKKWRTWGWVEDGGDAGESWREVMMDMIKIILQIYENFRE